MAPNALGPIKELIPGERFSPGEAVLAGVDLDSGYWLGLSLRERRRGEDWAEVLKQSQDPGLNLAEEKMALRF